MHRNSIADGVARLVDVAPTEIEVLSEETDWGLVGGDLRGAIEAAEREATRPASDDEELVEA